MLWIEILFVGCCGLITAAYDVPAAKIEVFNPRGFRVSIPDEEGIKLFAFHGKINEEMNGREGGTFSRDIVKAKDGRWTFYEPYQKLNVGDILYYWTYVDYFDGRNKLGYTNDDNMFVVKELINKDDNKPVTQSTVTPTSGCVATETVSSNPAKCSGELIFNEDFSAGIQQKWTVEQRFADSPDYEFVMYCNIPETLQVYNGILRIKPVLSEEVFGSGFVTSRTGFDFKENCTGIPGSTVCKKKYAGFILPPIISSQLTTKNKFSFKYGKIEIRAKLPKGDWIYPELFLNSVAEEYGPEYESGQIRIAFSGGNVQLAHTLHGGIIIGGSADGRTYGMKNIRSNYLWTDDFHRFGITWKPDSITVSVDDKIFGTIFPPGDGFGSLNRNLDLPHANRWMKGSRLAPFDKEMYMVLGVGVGGFSFEDREDISKPWTNGQRDTLTNFYNQVSDWKRTWDDRSALEVDYVKVWAV